MATQQRTYGGYIPPRKQRFSTRDAGKQHRPSGYFPNMLPSEFSPELLKNPQKQNEIWVLDPMTLQRKFMVEPNKSQNASAQRFSQLNGIYAQPYNCIPINPLSKLGIQLHDRLGNFGLMDLTQKPFYTASSYA
jgi:hypothetical protein